MKNDSWVFLTKATAKLIINVIHHGWVTNIFRTRLPKMVLNSIFVPSHLTEKHQICILYQKTWNSAYTQKRLKLQHQNKELGSHCNTSFVFAGSCGHFRVFSYKIVSSNYDIVNSRAGTPSKRESGNLQLGGQRGFQSIFVRGLYSLYPPWIVC